MDKTMIRFLAILAALTFAASAQTYRTVTADTNNAIRTNFTLGAAQISGSFAISNVAGLQSALDGKLATNGNGAGLTNLPNANLSSNVVGTLPVANGGTGATNAAAAISNLLPSYAGNTNRVLGLDATATTLVWTNASGGLASVDLASTNATGVLPLAKGGTGQTNARNALELGFAVYTGNGGVQFGQGATATNGVFGNTGAAVGRNATTQAGGAVGADAKARGAGGAVGNTAETIDGGSIGHNSRSTNGFAGGRFAVANADVSVQFGIGTNSSNNTIQFLSAGTVDTNEWARLAALSTYPTTNISVIGTNNTNTLVFSNGILVQVQ